MLGGYEGIIGALPVAQAVLLVPVLAQLIRLERERAASVGTTAVLASSRLAVAVQIFQRRAELQQPAEHIGDRIVGDRLLDLVLERLAGDVVHHEKRNVALQTEVDPDPLFNFATKYSLRSRHSLMRVARFMSTARDAIISGIDLRNNEAVNNSFNF